MPPDFTLVRVASVKVAPLRVAQGCVGQVRTDRGCNAQVRTGQVRTRQVRTVQVIHTGQDRTNQPSLSCQLVSSPHLLYGPITVRSTPLNRSATNQVAINELPIGRQCSTPVMPPDFTLVRVAPLRSTPLRSAPVRSASVRSAPGPIR